MIASLVLPCYNPAEGWEHTIYNNYTAFCDKVQIAVELILVIDGKGSPSGLTGLNTLKEQIPSLKVIEYEVNRGKGYAIRQGVAVATGDLIIYTDVDFPYTQGSLLKIYDSLRGGQCDVAIGIKDEQYYTHVPAVRSFISKGLRFFIRLFLSVPVTDTQCGLKGFKSEVKPIFLQTTIDRYLFDLEFIRSCYKSKKYSIVAIPVALNEHVHFRHMNYKILFSESVNFMKLLFKK